MGSLEKRLEALEAHTQTQQGYKIPRRVERYFHALDNARREIDGLEPLPNLPYTKEDYEDDLRTLHEHIPAMRTSAGWQKEEARTLLDEWERSLREKLEKGQTDGT